MILTESTFMNIVLIITAVIFLFGALNGLRKGLIRTVFSTFALIASLVIAAYGGPYAAKFLKTTPFYEQMCGKVQGAITLEIEEETTDQISGQIDTINQLPFPEEIKKGLIENNNSHIYEALGIDKFTQYMANYICMLIINVVSYILVFIIGYIVLRIIGLLLDGIADLPVIGGLNRLGGLILGMINGIAGIWVLFIIITIFCTTEWGIEAFRQINENQILTFIYNHNYLLGIIKNIGAML